MKKIILLILVILFVTAGLSAARPRAYTQKVTAAGSVISNQQFPDVTATSSQTQAGYIVNAWITTRPAEVISTATSLPAQIRLYRFGNGATVPYDTRIFVQFSMFPTDWTGGETLRVQVINNNVTPSRSGAYDLLIPDNLTSALTVTNPVEMNLWQDPPADPVVSPIILTRWHSSNPWNERCPGSVENRSNAGSHALALSQIMKFWAYPNSGVGSVSYVDDNYGLIESNFTSIINWDGMSNTLVFLTTQRYIFMCGASIYTNYELQNSSSNMVNLRASLVNHFGYSPTMTTLSRPDYSNVGWVNLIQAELDASRPVIYSAVLSDGYERAFIIDGYDVNGMFHIVWSDESVSDEWADIDLLSYNGESITIASQQMIIGIQPSTMDEYELNVVSIPSGYQIYKDGADTGFSTPHTFNSGETGIFALAPVAGFTWNPLSYAVATLAENTTITFTQVADPPMPDYPEGVPVAVAPGITITMTGDAANNVPAPVGVPALYPNPTAIPQYTATLELLGVGPWTISYSTIALLGIWYSYSAQEWFIADNIAGVITFTITATGSGIPELPIALGDESLTIDPTIERAALTDLYNATDGANWINNTNWLSPEPLSTWHGVTLEHGRVISLNLSNNDLSGIIPAELTELTELRTLLLPSNNLSQITSLAGLSLLQTLSINDNNLTFEDIEPILANAPASFSYSPQKAVYDSLDITILEDLSHTFISTIGGSQNQYQWYKDTIPFSTQSQFTINNLQGSNSGAYTCSITSPLVPNLTIYRNPINLTVVPTNDPPTIDLPASLTLNQNEPLSIDLAPYISDPDGNVLTLSAGGNTHLDIQFEALTAIISPQQNWTGSETVIITVNDGVIENRSRALASDNLTIHVINPMTIDFSAENDYNNNLVAGDATTAVLFTASSNQAITSWEWDFDNDGNVDSTLPYPGHFYSEPGYKSVHLQISDGIHVNWLLKPNYLLVHPGVVVPPSVLDQNIVWTEAGGPYNILGEVLLNPGYSLTIEPNAQVNLLVDSTLVINGSIDVDEADFTAYGPNGWAGIILNPSATNSNISGITVLGAVAGITVNGSNPNINGVTLLGANHARTPTVGIAINGLAQPSISGVNISNFNIGIKAINPEPSSVTLQLNDIDIYRESIVPNEDDYGIMCQGNCILELDNAYLEDFTNAIHLNGQDPFRARARITNVRVVKTESSTREPSTALELADLTNVFMSADSLYGYNTGIRIMNTSVPQASLDLSQIHISKTTSPNVTDNAIELIGSYTGLVDSMYIHNYSCGIESNGNQQLSIMGSTFSNCSTVYEMNQNAVPAIFSRNTCFRNSMFGGLPSAAAMLLNTAINPNIHSNTFYGFQNYVHATACQDVDLEQNIFFTTNPLASPISLTGSTINADYNDICLSEDMYPGTANINVNPIFENEAMEDFRLNVFSPCIDAGNPVNPPDPDGSFQDLGAFTFDWTSAPLIAQFGSDTTAGQCPLVVQFEDRSTRNSSSWNWDMNGDGTTDSNSQNPSFTYTEPGVYTVSLVVSDGVRFDTCEMISYITSENAAPIVLIPLPDLSLAEDFEELQIDLNDHFEDINNQALTYSCELDSNLVQIDLQQNTLSINSLEDVSGEVNVTITASDGNRSSRLSSYHQDKSRLAVSDTFTINIIAINDTPIIESFVPADSTLSISEPTDIQFSITATDIDSPLSYAWFVDGVNQGLAGNQFSHLFNSAGTFTIRGEVIEGMLVSYTRTWTIQSSVDGADEIIPVIVTGLSGIHPNPSTNTTTIAYSIKAETLCSISIYNLRGQLIRSLSTGFCRSGQYTVLWDGKDDAGGTTACGIYIVRMNAARKAYSSKLLRLP